MSDEQCKTKIKVLIVEDHVLTRIGVKAAIERDREIHVIGEAGTGVEGIAVFQKVNPDVVLMDVGMPEMDGIEAAAKIKENHPNAKIVMVTSHDNEKDVLASLAAGASGYCLKDAAPERLQQAIKAVHNGDAWLDSGIASLVLRSTTSSQDSSAISAKTFESASASSSDSPYCEPLSTREREVLSLIVDGLSNQEIADKLFISLATAKTHVRNILNKLAVNDRTQAAVRAMRQGLV